MKFTLRQIAFIDRSPVDSTILALRSALQILSPCLQLLRLQHVDEVVGELWLWPRPHAQLPVPSGRPRRVHNLFVIKVAHAARLGRIEHVRGCSTILDGAVENVLGISLVDVFAC